jgi:pimeloyl-ACP methyl ester carboxylesterase
LSVGNHNETTIRTAKNAKGKKKQKENMAFIQVNGARLYYEVFGDERPGRAPIVLIHGATSTGHRDWHLVAPLLAQEHRVIVPDCRGHGRSANPNLSYRFRELAADVAGLVRGLGYERAHIVGHSNGGNVALVTLLEHPEVVQTAILQAANAYVSAGLEEGEPAESDPDQVAREKPGWVREMVALHGPTHGPDYWRDLWRMTVRETATAPDYTPDDLARVQRPTFVIQGEHDRANAAAYHAQFIAHHVPDAESWIPTGIGHNVHVETPGVWVERVLGFLTRRGDDANDALYRLKRARYADGRETIFEVKANRREDAAVDVSGRVLTAEQRQAALETLSALSPTSAGLQVLLHPQTPWALVNRAVTDLRGGPRTLTERLDQATLGEALRILEDKGDWALVRLERDGYLGWIQTAALHRCEEITVRDYHATCNALVRAGLAQAYAEPSRKSSPIGKLPFCVAVPIVERRDSFAAIHLPDDRLWWLESDDLLPFGERPRPTVEGIAFTLGLIRRFVGVPYLWGGRTPFGYDCSGLAQAFWGFMDVALPRDSDQQYHAGRPVLFSPDGNEGGEKVQPGDLLFFGDAACEETFTPLKVTHVAISLGGDEFIHANGAAWSVSYNSFDPAAPNYRTWLREHLLAVKRFGDLT